MVSALLMFLSFILGAVRPGTEDALDLRIMFVLDLLWADCLVYFHPVFLPMVEKWDARIVILGISALNFSFQRRDEDLCVLPTSPGIFFWRGTLQTLA